MTLNRTKGLTTHTPLPKMSARRAEEFAARGFTPMSTFRPAAILPRAAKMATPRRAYTGPKRSVCDLVDLRSGLICEWPGCCAPQDHRHHRLNRKMGGRHGEARERLNSAAWLLGVCFTHHEIATNPPEDMVDVIERMGWILREHQDATQVEVFTRHHVDPVWLDNAGEWHDYDSVSA